LKRFFAILIFFFVSLLSAIEINLDSNLSSLNKSNNLPYFGESLFQGEFKKSSRLRYTPEYLINIGDVVSVKLWGAYNYSGDLKVDSRGNIFIPKVGNIKLLGVANSELKRVIESNVKKVFNNNVFVYANLNSYQAISIYVTGAVVKPGIYDAFVTDSILQLIDKAGGIKRGEGSFRDIDVLRSNRVIKKFDLYDFLSSGRLSLFQFQNGDVVRVGTLKRVVAVLGDVRRECFFELDRDSVSVEEIAKYVILKPEVTHFIITKFVDGEERIEQYPVSSKNIINVSNGDKIKFVSDYLKQNLTVKIEGEHGGLHSITIRKGESLQDLLSKIILTPLSDIDGIRLYRKSVAKRQKQLIDANLKDLEARVLTTGSSTTEEAKIRKEESKMVLDFINRASKIKPKGQVIINEKTPLSEVILEDGDVVYIPKKSRVVVVEGEVSLPNAQTYVEDYSVDDYINSCGGFSPRANREKVLLVKKNGKVLTYNATSWWDRVPLKVEAGDSILVLGRVDSKNIQITSSITQIIYQIAVSAAVVLKAF